MRVLRLCGQYRLPRRWENKFRRVTGCKGNSFCSITKRIAWGATIITCGDREMLESMITFLLLMILFSLSFVMMSGLESQAFRMWLKTRRIDLCMRDGLFPLLS